MPVIPVDEDGPRASALRFSNPRIQILGNHARSRTSEAQVPEKTSQTGAPSSVAHACCGTDREGGPERRPALGQGQWTWGVIVRTPGRFQVGRLTSEDVRGLNNDETPPVELRQMASGATESALRVVRTIRCRQTPATRVPLYRHWNRDSH